MKCIYCDMSRALNVGSYMVLGVKPTLLRCKGPYLQWIAYCCQDVENTRFDHISYNCQQSYTRITQEIIHNEENPGTNPAICNMNSYMPLYIVCRCSQWLENLQYRLVMSTIPKRKHECSDIEANYRDETKSFWCVPKTEVEHFYLVQKLWIEIITFWCVPEHFKSKSGRFYVF